MGARETKREQRLNNRLPVQPLIDRYGEDFLKTHGKSVQTWLNTGLSPYIIDKLCCARGNHPYEVYGDAWFEPIWNQDKEKEKKRELQRR